MPSHSEHVRSKAARLLAEGRVRPDPAPARIFRVEGDSDTYTTVIGAHTRLCTCPHGTQGAPGDCSHIESCVAWVLAEGDRARGRPSPIAEYEEALQARLTFTAQEPLLAEEAER